MTQGLIAPHGGKLVDLIATPERAEDLKTQSKDWPSWNLTPRQVCDLELLMNGSFSPLKGFLGRKDYESVCESMRLSDGTLWPMPITLDVSDDFAKNLKPGAMIALRDPEGVMLAAMSVEDLWRPDREAEALRVFGSTNLEHPGVAHVLQRSHATYVGGKVEGLSLPHHYDFRHSRLTPRQTRAEFERLGWTKIVAFQTRNPMHRAHQELTVRACKEVGANLLIHPVVGLTKPGDVDHYTRVRCYEAILDSYPKDGVKMSLLNLAMRMGGPREAVWHAIIRKNHGCTHFIVGRDHAGPGKDSTGKPFYGPYDAQELMKKHVAELGVEMVDFKAMVWMVDQKEYAPVDEIPAGTKTLDISGTQLRELLQTGRDIPEWFTFPKVADELRKSHPPRNKQGFSVFFTGLSGSGKSTIANVLLVKLLEIGGRDVTFLDGDLVRKHLSSELGFSKEHRDINIRRIGWVAGEVTKAGGMAICCPIAPYDSIRKEVRGMIQPNGGFILVHVATPLEVCEKRDRKGLYAKARAGILKEFTGISDPYETPTDAELVIDTTETSAEEAAEQVLGILEREGFVRGRQVH